MFQITHEPIIPAEPDDPTVGGIVTFEGRVRNLNEGRAVLALEYEAFQEMAATEGTSLLKEAKLKFGLDWVAATHRIGRLEIGETAVWIGCGSPHRKEAFLACEFIIDELKHRLPIWKREHYQDGSSDWVNLHRSPIGAKIVQSDVFARQIAMPEIGPGGQLALQNARVLVVGAGGLANSALPYLAGAGVGLIGIVEPELLEPSNLHRQVLFGHNDVGRSKAQLAAASIRRLHPFTQVEAMEVRLHLGNAEGIVSRYDVVVDGTDRFDAKFLMNDVCQRLGRPLVQASIHRLDGFVQTILPGGPCLRCQWENPPLDGCVNTCEEAGVLGVVPGFFGILQATETIKLITGMGEPLSRHQLLADLRDFFCQRIARNPKPGCICSEAPGWHPIQTTLYWEVTAEAVRAWTRPFTCIDLREEDESRQKIQLGQREWRRVPLSTFQPEQELEDLGDVLLVCATGGRSARMTSHLREQGFHQVFSLKGGVRGCNTVPQKQWTKETLGD